MATLLEQPETFQRALAHWYEQARRPLPWRTQPSLYRTVISECMLQQTQIKTMLPYYERWLLRFPDFPSLAEAPPEDVLKHWEGLGYYSRARNLHKLAQAFIQLPETPQTPAQWRALPGVGPYTAAAISSIAQSYPAAVVDGNVVRILARLTRDERSFKNNAEAVKALSPSADALLDRQNPGDHNQAMMELGATVCLKHKPLCTICPVLPHCASARGGDPTALPRIQRRPTEHLKIQRFWIEHAGRLLLHRIPHDAGQLAGQHELPASHHLHPSPEPGQLLATKTRSITHRRIKEAIHLPKHPPAQATLQSNDLHWISLKALHTLILSGPHRRWIAEIQASKSSF